MLRYFSITSQAEQQYLSLSAGLPGARTSLPRSSRWGFSPGSATRGHRSLQGFCSGSHPAASCSASSCGTQGQPQQTWPCTARQVGSDPKATLLHTGCALCSEAPKPNTGAQHAEVTVSPLGVSVLHGIAEKTAAVKSTQGSPVMVEDQIHQV